jgi:hypothetical protein
MLALAAAHGVTRADVSSRLGRAPGYTERAHPRLGDHVWWVSGKRRFERHRPGWRIYEANVERWQLVAAD